MAMNSMFTGGWPPTTSTPAVPPNQQVVIPQITIPQYQRGMFTSPINQITVNGREAAKNYQLPPNSRVAIFDEKDPIFYFKETDESGNVISFIPCSYAEITDPPEPEYLTVAEFRTAMDDFAKKIKEDVLNGESVRAQSGKPQYNGQNSGKQPNAQYTNSK